MPVLIKNLDMDQMLHIPDIIREAGYTTYIDRDKVEQAKNT